ncbi:MAG TPA: DUF2520 domain-containing protein [Crocinitomix sp.]|nr:DUF2520 domain-containing protein [Crocinitomix sp.]
MITKINIIGAGNVATHLAKVLFANQIKITTIYSKQLSNAIQLANKVQAIPTHHLNGFDTNVDLNIICVKDDAIKEVIKFLPKDIPLVHTSGSVEIDVLSDFKQNGILYPLQTFSKNRTINMAEIPFLIETNTTFFRDILTEFCHKNLSTFTQITSSELRKKIHLSAVISNNFITALLHESEKILDKEGIDLKLLKPLLFETLQKAFEESPLHSQTGPAKRKDFDVISKQSEMINHSKLKQIYNLITELIIEQQNTIV